MNTLRIRCPGSTDDRPAMRLLHTEGAVAALATRQEVLEACGGSTRCPCGRSLRYYEDGEREPWEVKE